MHQRAIKPDRLTCLMGEKVVAFGMLDKLTMQQQIAVYYAAGIILAAVAFRLVRAWLRKRRRKKPETLW